MAKKKIALFFVLFSFCITARAEKIQFAHLTFNAPAGWQCDADGRSMICLDKTSQSEKNSAIVLSYKTKSPQDSFTVYRDQLTRPRSIKQGETTSLSQPMGVRELTINGTKWIEGIHFGAELPNYYTHYYATTIGNWAYLLSVSIEKTAHQGALQKIQPTLNSLNFENINEMLQSPSTKSNAPVSTEGASQDDIQTSEPSNINQLRSSQTVQFLGFQFKIFHLFLGAGLIIVLGMMGYVLTMD